MKSISSTKINNMEMNSFGNNGNYYKCKTCKGDYIKINLDRDEFLSCSNKIYDFSGCNLLKRITVYNYINELYNYKIKYDGNKTIVIMDMYSDPKTRGFYYLSDARKICTLIFIGSSPIKVTVSHDKKAHDEFLEWCIN